MVVHISGDRKQVSVVSIPRDTLVTLYDASGVATHKAKINAAFSEYGPAGAIATVEHLTNLRMDHIAIIDWAGFKDLSTAVGGVPVHIPQSFYDPKQKVQWNAGDHVLEGKEALAVRPDQARPPARRLRPDRAAAELHALADERGPRRR